MYERLRDPGGAMHHQRLYAHIRPVLATGLVIEPLSHTSGRP